MRIRVFLSIMLAIACLPVLAQMGPERQAIVRMQKGKWKSAEESLRKSIRKDTLNPEAKFIFSKYYFAADNPSRSIDSAYRYTLLAVHDFVACSPKEKERMKRIPLDSSMMVEQRREIDSAAFERAKTINTEKAYSDFLMDFIYAREKNAAIELRDEVAFVEALKINTYKVFLDYTGRYPDSHRLPDAKQRYEKLLYEEETREGRLKNYQAFYKEHPGSPFHRDAEKNIFEIMTASGKPDAWQAFLNSYPDGNYHGQAEAVLYHILNDEEESNVTSSPDSLKRVHSLEQGYWVPVLRRGKFGFIDHQGADVLTPQFESIDAAYLCGNIREDYLRVDNGIISRDGHWITKGPLLDVSDVGAGFLKINSGSCLQLIHKSGQLSGSPCREEVKMLARNFIAFKEHSKWGLTSLAGRTLVEAQYDDVEALDGLVVLVRNGKKTIVTMDEVAALADKNPLPTARVYDDVRRIAPGSYVVRNGSLEGVLTSSLEFDVPLNRQRISKAQAGIMLDRGQKYFLVGIAPNLDSIEFSDIQFYGNWIKLKTKDALRLYDLQLKRTIRYGLDSLWFENDLAFARKHDSLTVYLKSGNSLDFEASTKVNIIKSAGTSRYFFAPEKTKKAVFNSRTGKKLFAFDFDEVEAMGEGIFLVTVGNKRGLLSESGKVILPLEYSAIIPAGPGVVSLLRDKKFGLYQVRTKKLLKPVYDRNVVVAAAGGLVAYKGSGYGFIGWDAKPLGPFEFEEVRPWNDSSALVKKNFQWMIYNIVSGKVMVDKIKDYRFISESSSEKVVLIHRDNFFGILSSKRGQIIPANFSELINVGSDEDPLYFAEKNVEEAEIYVVLYYDKNGKLLGKQVYEEEEYERIYCPRNN